MYQNWIVDLGRDPEAIASNREPVDRGLDAERVERIYQAVNSAMVRLDEDEREFIIRFHHLGESYRQISEKSGRPVYKLESLHMRALKRLRMLLASFVGETFGLVVEERGNCPICNSVSSEEMNEIIRNRDRTSTWKPVLDLFRSRYNLVIRSPQLLVGHEKYHMGLWQCDVENKPTN